MTLDSDQAKDLQSRWAVLKTDIGQRWPELSQSDLSLIDGDSQKLVALVHQRTGGNLTEIEVAIDEIASRSHGLMTRITRTVADQGASLAHTASNSTSVTVERVTEAINENPMRTIAYTVAAGAVAGVLLCGLFSSPRKPDTHWRHWR